MVQALVQLSWALLHWIRQLVPAPASLQASVHDLAVVLQPSTHVFRWARHDAKVPQASTPESVGPPLVPSPGVASVGLEPVAVPLAEDAGVDAPSVSASGTASNRSKSCPHAVSDRPTRRNTTSAPTMVERCIRRPPADR